MRDSFMAHHQRTLISSNRSSPAWISDGEGCVGGGGRGSGGYKACVSMLRLAGGIHLIHSGCYGGRPRALLPPRSARPRGILSGRAASVPGRISALHREERINTTTQLICINIPREPGEHGAAPLSYKTRRSTVPAVRGFNRDHRSLLPFFWTLFMV